jgi:hypothetical protein
MSLLDTLGKDFKGIFAWLGSSTGQNIIKTGEGVVEAIYPPATAIINVANTWLTEILKTQALATAAGAQSGSNTQKAAAALNSAAPQMIAFAQQYGLPTPTAEQLQSGNAALVAFLNSFPGLAGAATIGATTSQTVGASTITATKVG